MKIELQSFGRKYGLPEADMIFDVRCMENPYWVPELRAMSGLDRPVRDYIFQNEKSTALVCTLVQLLMQQTAMEEARGSDVLRVAIGCTGGRHRSVAVTEHLAQELARAGHEVLVKHRDIARGS